MVDSRQLHRPWVTVVGILLLVALTLGCGVRGSPHPPRPQAIAAPAPSDPASDGGCP